MVALLSDGVSVVVPAHNAAEHIALAVASALAPSAVPVEVVVVDDASTDGTAAIVRRLAEADPRVRLVSLHENGGPSRARNRGIEAARHEWIGLLDADDRWMPGRLDRLAALVASGAADVVSDDTEVADLAGHQWSLNRSVGRSPARGDPLGLLEYARRGWVPRPVARKALFLQAGGFDERVAYGEDTLLYTRWLLGGARWVEHPAPGYVYVRRRGSLTGGGGEPRQLVGVLERLRQESIKAGRPDVAVALRPRARRARADAAFADAIRASRRGSVGERARSLAALLPHTVELGRRVRDGVAGRLRLAHARRSGSVLQRSIPPVQ